MSERGAAPIELALGVLAILVPVALLVLSFGPWMERRTFVRAAAAEAARFVVASNGDEPGAAVRVGDMATSSGIPAASVQVAFCPAEGELSGTCLLSGRLPRDGSVWVWVETDVPGVTTPFGTVGSFVTGYRHLEPVDPYRSLP